MSRLAEAEINCEAPAEESKERRREEQRGIRVNENLGQCINVLDRGLRLDCGGGAMERR